jgi:hypothetical protein
MPTDWPDTSERLVQCGIQMVAARNVGCPQSCGEYLGTGQGRLAIGPQLGKLPHKP